MRLSPALLIGALLACRSQPPPAPRAQPAAPPAPDVAPAGPVGVAPPDVLAAVPSDLQEPFGAYRDEGAVAELARDPQWHIPRDGEDSYACAGGAHPQSCTPNPCHEGVGQDCRTGCEHTCDGCEAGCRAAAVRCAAPCADGACRLACARTNAACIDACIQAKDRCLTGECDPRQRTCEAAQERAFHEGPCRPACLRCSRQCEGRDNMGDCFRACFRRTRGCTQGQQNICVMVGPGYGAPGWQ